MKNKDYKVKCEQRLSKVDKGGLYLSVTHNGYQWESISIVNAQEEIPLMIKALTTALKSL